MFARTVAALAFACAMAAPLGARADEAGEARTFVEHENARLEAALALPDPLQRGEALRRVVRELVDFDAMTDRTFEGLSLSPAQSVEVRDLMRGALEQRTVRALAESPAIALTCLSQKATAPHVVQVRVEARSKSNLRAPSVRVDYVVREEAGAFRVVDLRMEGASITEDYRRSIAAMLAPSGGGYARVVESLRGSATRVAAR
jgi:ABC-type transporter MlaC component